MYDVTTDTAALDWSPTGWPGVSMKMIRHDESTGGVTGMMRLAPGSTIPAHRHTQSDQIMYILEGDLTEANVTFGPGTYLVAKAGSPHGPHGTTNGCVLLSIYPGTPDFVPAE